MDELFKILTPVEMMQLALRIYEGNPDHKKLKDFEKEYEKQLNTSKKSEHGGKGELKNKSMINWIKKLLEKAESRPLVHEHEWKHEYETGRNDSKWINDDGNYGFSKSDVYSCSCGVMAVKHRSEGKFHVLK